MGWPDLVAGMDLTLLATLGTDTTYTPASTGVATVVRGLFDEAYVSVTAGNAIAGVSTARPMVFYRLSDLPTDPDDDYPTIVVNGVTYELAAIEKDGQGGVKLFLRRL